MRGTQKIALDPRLWVFVGVVVFSLGLFFYLDNRQGFLLLLVGSFIVFTTLYIWAAAALWRSRKTEHHEQAPSTVKPTDEIKEINYPEPLLTPSQVGNANISLLNTESETAIPWHKSQEPNKELGPTLVLQIDEEPLTLTHLVSTLSVFLSLYVKMWLLQQDRFADFVIYTEHKDYRFEKEANLPIAELKYNSPAVISISIDQFPKAIAEAIQILIDIFSQWKLRRQLMKEKVREAHLKNIDLYLDQLKKIDAMLNKVSPKLNQEELKIARQSLAVDVIQLLKYCNLQLSGKPPSPTLVDEGGPPSEQILAGLKSQQVKVHV